MKKTLHKLLRLQSLTLLRQGLKLSRASVKQQRMDELESRINRLRHQVPGAALSQFDAAARKFADHMMPVSRERCGGLQCGPSPAPDDGTKGVDGVGSVPKLRSPALPD